HGLASSFGVGSIGDQNTHAVRHRRTSAQPGPAQGIPIRPLRPRGRGHIDPVEFAEYAVAHMRPSPRFTPMGHGYPLGSSMTSESRGSLPRSFRSAQPLLSGLLNASNHSPADPSASQAAASSLVN
ncbi:hypothetical protein IWW54_002498, partial [Coemansia sp. RSA 2705]